MSNQESADWDFFISYTQADRRWAEWTAWQLTEAGHKVLIQAWHFVPGDRWMSRMNDGIARSVRTIAILSESYMSSVYGGVEWQAAWKADPEGLTRKLLPVRVTDCTPVGILGQVVWIDLVGLDQDGALEALRQGVSAAISGSIEPSSGPNFPGVASKAAWAGSSPADGQVSRPPDTRVETDTTRRYYNHRNSVRIRILGGSALSIWAALSVPGYADFLEAISALTIGMLGVLAVVVGLRMMQIPALRIDRLGMHLRRRLSRRSFAWEDITLVEIYPSLIEIESKNSKRRIYLSNLEIDRIDDLVYAVGNNAGEAVTIRYFPG